MHQGRIYHFVFPPILFYNFRDFSLSFYTLPHLPSLFIFYFVPFLPVFVLYSFCLCSPREHVYLKGILPLYSSISAPSCQPVSHCLCRFPRIQKSPHGVSTGSEALAAQLETRPIKQFKERDSRKKFKLKDSTSFAYRPPFRATAILTFRSPVLTPKNTLTDASAYQRHYQRPSFVLRNTKVSSTIDVFWVVKRLTSP